MKFDVIPAIDLLGGQVVRLSQGKYNQVSRYAFSPAELATLYEQHGATRIHIVDLDGAKAGEIVNWNAIKAIRASVSCELELGGGIRSMDTATKLIDLGINFIIIGSLLVKAPLSAYQLIDQLGPKIIAGIDCHGNAVATEGWEHDSQITLRELVQSLEEKSIGGIIFTDISTDGMLCGPNIPALQTLSQSTRHPIIASGGIRDKSDIEHLKSLAKNRITGCILGKSILEGHIPLSELWS